MQRVKRYAGQTMRTARNPNITARECIELANWLAANTTPPAAAVQEGRDWSLLEATQQSLREHMAEIKRLKAAQPAVPDAFGTREGEHPQYIEGWNDCRAEMLKGMKP